MKKSILLLMLMSVLPMSLNAKAVRTANIYTGMYGSTIAGDNTLPMLGAGLEWTVGSEKVYWYGKMQYNHTFGSYNSYPDMYLNANSMQFSLTGLGFNMLNTRNRETGRGWTMGMNMSVGFGMYFGVDSAFYDTMDSGSSSGGGEYYPGYIIGSMAGALAEGLSKGLYGMMSAMYMPVEVSLVTRYHLSERTALQLGLNGAVYFTIHQPRYVYGASLGLTF